VFEASFRLVTRLPCFDGVTFQLDQYDPPTVHDLHAFRESLIERPACDCGSPGPVPFWLSKYGLIPSKQQLDPLICGAFAPNVMKSWQERGLPWEAVRVSKDYRLVLKGRNFEPRCWTCATVIAARSLSLLGRSTLCTRSICPYCEHWRVYT
jgi:hypothetical protein